MIIIKKIERDYLDKYKDIPKDYYTRLMDLIDVRNSKKQKLNLLKETDRILSINKKKVEFIIYLSPKATPRPRENRMTKRFYVLGAKDNKDVFEKFLKENILEQIITSTWFDCKIYMDIPSDANKTERILAEMGLIRPHNRPDWDNLGKTYSDMIQGQFLNEDSLIVDGRVRKYYSTKPRIEITIKYMEDFDSDFNRKRYLRRKGD